MTDDLLEHLLEAEARAQQLVQSSDEERQAILTAARAEARKAEDNFAQRVVEIQTALLNQAEQRAGRAIADLQREYEQRRLSLQAQYEQRGQVALAAALALFKTTETD